MTLRAVISRLGPETSNVMTAVLSPAWSQKAKCTLCLGKEIRVLWLRASERQCSPNQQVGHWMLYDEPDGAVDLKLC